MTRAARRPAVLARPGARRARRGQSLVEFALIVPVFMMLLLGMLEFGIAFTHEQTLAYATREGARTGAALAVGTTAYPCSTANFDAPIIAAVQRIVEASGSPVDASQVGITIYKAKADGSSTGSENAWVYAKGGGPTVDGLALDYKQTSSGWSPCSRTNGSPADALGVAVTYQYQFRTAFAGIFRFIGGTTWNSLTMSDHTVMNLNPTAQ
ncbi:MAG TPA: TadE family protein [Acidimicrobiales bacterium]|nr:TadE family protein [Acidimicrobiales bacterium]